MNFHTFKLVSLQINNTRSRLSLALFAITFCLGVTQKSLSADEVTRWNEVATKAAFDSGLAGNSLFESRVYAMTQAAVHDALNRIDRRYSPYVPSRRIRPDASPEAAVATAAHDVLLDQLNQLVAFGFPSQESAISAAYTASLALIPDSPAKAKGIIVGKAAALALLGLRAGDGWNTQTVRDF